MKRKWLAEGLAAEAGDEAHLEALVEAAAGDEELSDLQRAQLEADSARAELAEADPETWAVERDQHNNPVSRKKLTRKQRRHLAKLNRINLKKAKRAAAKAQADGAPSVIALSLGPQKR